MSIHAKALAAVSAVAVLCASPALAADSQMQRKIAKTAEPKKKLTTSQSNSAATLKTETLGSFTPPMLDTVRKSATGGVASVQERTFRFTPSGKAKDRNALALGVTSRVVRAVAPEAGRSADLETASAYNVDVSVGFKGFAVTGGYSKLDSVLQPDREGLDLGLSYRGDRWKTALQLNAERDSSAFATPFSLDKRYTVELGGAYSLNQRLSVIGGVRYQMMEPDTGRFGVSGSKSANEGEAGAVYLGTAISF